MKIRVPMAWVPRPVQWPLRVLVRAAFLHRAVVWSNPDSTIVFECGGVAI